MELRGAGRSSGEQTAAADDASAPGAQTDAEVKAELRQARAELSKFKRYLGTTAYLQTGPARQGAAATAPPWRPRTRPSRSSA